MSANTDYVYNTITTSNLSGTFGNTWDSNVSQSVVDNALLEYGVSTEAEMSNEKKKKTLLKYFTWVQVRDMLLVTPSSYSADGESFSFDKDVLDKRVTQAKAEAAPYLSSAQVQISRITFPDDPYTIHGQIQHAE
jgi:hypothetical protein